MESSHAPRPASHSGLLLVLSLLVLGVAAATALRGRDLLDSRAELDPEARPRTVVARGDLAGDERASIELFQGASPAVVHITTLSVRRSGFSLSPQQMPEGTGSGFLWDRDGHVVTNYHVIRGADAAEVTLADGSSWRARLVGSEPDYDLAVLAIDAPRSNLVALPLGSSRNLLVGQKVFAIGNPFGLDQTLTTGVISGLDREIQSVGERPIAGVIQTDAAINPGNSGGPLLDSAGRLIGVNTAIATHTGTYAGVGFAVPVDTVNRVVPHLLRHGRVQRPAIGVTIASDPWARQLGVEGVVVTSVLPGSGAERAGLVPAVQGRGAQVELGDVIVGVGGRSVRRQDDLFAILEDYVAGQKVELEILREEQRLSLEVELGVLSSME